MELHVGLVAGAGGDHSQRRFALTVEATRPGPSRSTNPSGAKSQSAATSAKNLNRARPRQAACTAPPDIHVWRLADDDPAEPTSGGLGRGQDHLVDPQLGAGDLLGQGSRTPAPTSAQAQVMVATPSDTRQAADE